MASQPGTRLTREALRARLAGDGARHPEAPGPMRHPSRTGTDEEQVTQWLTLLHLLSGVPFNYLVPDLGMLPAESIRFFQVDGNWIEALLDGAFSIGSAAVAQGISRHGRHAFLAAAAARARSGEQRRELLARVRRRTSFAPPPAPAPPPDTPEVLTGFLLRSAVVAGWPGMEVSGFAATQAPLQIVRMETVAPSLLLCIFAGVVASVELREPGETVHFGLTANGAAWQQELRYANGSQVGEFIPGAAGTLPVTLRGSGTPAIVPMNALAQSMSTLVWDGTPPQGTTFTAAQFGLEMVQGAQKVAFQVTPS